MPVGDASLKVHGRELQSAASTGNSTVPVWLRLAAGTMDVMGIAGQC
jgi:hypothetical protein